MSTDIPPCFCNEDKRSSCDWIVEIDGRYYRKGEESAEPAESAESAKISWRLDGIPQPLAQIVFQASIAAVNEKGWDVYVAWLTECLGEDSDAVKMLSKVGTKALSK